MKFPFGAASIGKVELQSNSDLIYQDLQIGFSLGDCLQSQDV